MNSRNIRLQHILSYNGHSSLVKVTSVLIALPYCRHTINHIENFFTQGACTNNFFHHSIVFLMSFCLKGNAYCRFCNGLDYFDAKNYNSAINKKHEKRLWMVHFSKKFLSERRKFIPFQNSFVSNYFQFSFWPNWGQVFMATWSKNQFES